MSFSKHSFYFGVTLVFLLGTVPTQGLRLNSIAGYLDGHVIHSLPTQNAILCGEKCSLRNDCESFNFYKQERRCDLNDATRDAVPSDFVSVTRGKGLITYHERQENIYENITNPCAGHGCKHGGHCIPDYNNSENSTRCQCRTGWTGTYCDVRDVPGWSDWSLWSDGCSATCGTAVKVRHRKCGNGNANRGNCDGNRAEIQRCYGENSTCPEWSMWSKVGTCSSSCGQGTVLRTRECMHGWSTCDGQVEETVTCRRPSCEVPWRLADGSRLGEGRLEVYNDITGQWGTVSSNGWQQADTDVACRTLGYIAPLQDATCSGGWSLYNGRCYKFENGKKKFKDARKHCADRQSELTIITSSGEDEFVRDNLVIPEGHNIWLGALNGEAYEGPYTNTLYWINGDEVLYLSNLNVNADPIPLADRVCLAMDDGGAWYLEDDCNKKKRFVCEKQPESVSPSFTHEFSPGSGVVHRVSCTGSESHVNQCTLIGWGDRTTQLSATHHEDVGLKCAVNGEWTIWSTWTACPNPCVPDNTRSRERSCTNPAPVLNGLSCIGDSSEQEPCPCTP